MTARPCAHPQHGPPRGRAQGTTTARPKGAARARPVAPTRDHPAPDEPAQQGQWSTKNLSVAQRRRTDTDEPPHSTVALGGSDIPANAPAHGRRHRRAHRVENGQGGTKHTACHADQRIRGNRGGYVEGHANDEDGRAREQGVDRGGRHVGGAAEWIGRHRRQSDRFGRLREHRGTRVPERADERFAIVVLNLTLQQVFKVKDMLHTESAFAKIPWTCETTNPLSHDERLTRASRASSEGALTRDNAAQTQCHPHLRHCLATPKQLICLFFTTFSPTPQGGHHGSSVQSPLRSLRHADHASGRQTSGETAGSFDPSPTLSPRDLTSFAPEESPASPSSAWRSAPAPAAPPCPHRAAVGVAAAGARRRRRAASAAPTRTRAMPRCGRRLGVRRTGGPRPFGRRGGHCGPVATAR